MSLGSDPLSWDSRSWEVAEGSSVSTTKRSPLSEQFELKGLQAHLRNQKAPLKERSPERLSTSPKPPITP